MPAPFFLDGPGKAEIDEAIALARAWAILMGDPPVLVANDDYSSKQWAAWSQQYSLESTESATAAEAAQVAAEAAQVAAEAAQAAAEEAAGEVGANAITALTGDVTASGSGSVAATIANDAVTYAKMQNVSATNKVLGRSTAGAGDVEEIACTAAGRALIGGADAAAQRLTLGILESFVVACSDETTALTAGAGKITLRMPYAFTLTAVRASLTTAQASGSIFTVDINEGGATVLSTKITIDNTEKTSTTAATPAVISDSSLADDAEITVDIDQIGNGTAKGLKVALIGYRT